MSRNVADLLWEMLANAGVKRCYGIVGDALNPVIDGLRRNGKIEFIHVRHEEYGVFAAVAEACLAGNPVAVCGTAGPGVVHLFNGLMDARKEGAPIIAIAGDVESQLIDTEALEELNPYKFFETASLYTARLVNPGQARAIITTAILTAVTQKGPTVISIPGDVAMADVAVESTKISVPSAPLFRPSDADLKQLATMINDAKAVAIFGGEGCRDARDEVIQLANKLKAPVGYSFRGKQWLEHDNPNAVGMTGLLGYGGAYKAIHEADLLLLLGTDFPFSEFLPGHRVKKVQIDKNPKHVGRRTALDLGLVGDIQSTVAALLKIVSDKTDGRFLEKHVAETKSFHELLQHYVVKGPGIKPIRPEFLAATLSELASDEALFFADTGTACMWLARHIQGGRSRRLFGSFSWASMANAAPNAFGAQLAFPGRQTIALCGDGGFTMLGLGDLLTQVERKTPVVQIILNNESLDFVNIEQQEAGMLPFGVEFKNPNFAKVAEAMGAKGIRIEEPGDVRGGLAEALAHKGGPVVVDAVVDPFALSMPSHVPFHAAKGFTLSLAKQVWNGKMDAVIKTMERNVRLV
ncbi:MAG TPA: thiamine pyrophosphate-dependent enzyme [Planctomycetaceae bacterium]|jgi:pyruvate dehydrogenase (quinone)|nr:thiamine pyrophosphate-dependent enzyme [Planctomycetaceae bacterium]